MNKYLIYLKKLIKRTFTFLTTWVFVSFILLNLFRDKFSPELEKIIITSTLTCSLYGFLIIRYYNHNISKKIKKFVNIMDVIFHVLPFLFIIFLFKLRKSNINLLMLLAPLILVNIYFSINDPRQVYSFTRWKKKETFMLYGYPLYLFFLFCYNK